MLLVALPCACALAVLGARPAAAEGAPVEAAPVEAAPVEGAPIEAAPVEAALIEAAPAAEPAEAAPVVAAPPAVAARPPASTHAAANDGDRAERAAIVVAGASAAGFVGGALIAAPALFSLLAVSPYVAIPAALLALASGAALGAFVGALPFMKIAPSAGAAGLVAVGAAGGAALGAFAGGALGTDATSIVVGALVGGAAGGMAASAGTGALAALWLTPSEAAPPPAAPDRGASAAPSR